MPKVSIHQRRREGDKVRVSATVTEEVEILVDRLPAKPKGSMTLDKLNQARADAKDDETVAILKAAGFAKKPEPKEAPPAPPKLKK